MKSFTVKNFTYSEVLTRTIKNDVNRDSSGQTRIVRQLREKSVFAASVQSSSINSAPQASLCTDLRS